MTLLSATAGREQGPTGPALLCVVKFGTTCLTAESCKPYRLRGNAARNLANQGRAMDVAQLLISLVRAPV
jgi:hypothetical protein